MQCPLCKQINGKKTGNQPNGRMTHTSNKRSSLPGHSGCGVITITYDIRDGIQVGDDVVDINILDPRLS